MGFGGNLRESASSVYIQCSVVWWLIFGRRLSFFYISIPTIYRIPCVSQCRLTKSSASGRRASGVAPLRIPHPLWRHLSGQYLTFWEDASHLVGGSRELITERSSSVTITPIYESNYRDLNFMNVVKQRTGWTQIKQLGSRDCWVISFIQLYKYDDIEKIEQQWAVEIKRNARAGICGRKKSI